MTGQRPTASRRVRSAATTDRQAQAPTPGRNPGPPGPPPGRRAVPVRAGGRPGDDGAWCPRELPVAGIRVVLADSQPLFRDGLRRILKAERDIDVVGEASDGVEALRLVVALKPDVVLMDSAMPRLTGLAILEELKKAASPARAILMMAGSQRIETLRALQVGARGILPRETTAPLIVKSVRATAAGEYWVNHETIADLVEVFEHSTAVADDMAAQKLKLTRRETDILMLVAGGFCNHDIARQCGISEDTVKHHLTSLFAKTGTATRLQLGLFAARHRLTAAS